MTLAPLIVRVNRLGHSSRAAVTVTATLGFGLASVASSMIYPFGGDPWRYLDASPHTGVLLVCLSVVAGALARIPVGILADRYGARVVLPAVAIGGAVAVVALNFAGSVPAAVVAACALGTAGAVTSAHPVGKRGLRLSGYGAGLGGLAVAVAVSPWMVDEQGRTGLFLLAVALVACAVVGAFVIPGRPVAPPLAEPVLQATGWLLRLPVTRHLAAWYAVAFGGLLGLGLYLPYYLPIVHRVEHRVAALATAAVLATAAAAHAVGGWLSERRDPVRLLATAYVTAAGLTLVLGLEPPFVAAAAAAALLAACLGVAGGVILTLIGRAAPAGRVGVISGAVGAAGGVAGLVAPAVLSVAYAYTGSHSTGWAVLAGLSLATATYLRAQPGWSGAALAFPPDPAARGPATTVVSLAAADAARNPQGVVAALGALATVGDMVIVYGGREAPLGGMTPCALADGLRGRLPRRAVAAVQVGERVAAVERGTIADMLDDGAIVLVCTPAADLDAVAAPLADRLGAGEVLRLTDHHICGSRLLSLPWPADTLAHAGQGR